jgi:hypothetical protein
MEKTKRIFYFIFNNKKCGKFTGERPIQIAKKITNKKLNYKIKEIEFYLDEIGGKNKRYGPYHGCKDKNTNKISVSIVKKNKIMKGGKEFNITHVNGRKEKYELSKFLKDFNQLEKPKFTTWEQHEKYYESKNSYRIDFLIYHLYEQIMEVYPKLQNSRKLQNISELPNLEKTHILALNLDDYCTSEFCSAGIYNYNNENPYFNKVNMRYIKYKNSPNHEIFSTFNGNDIISPDREIEFYSKEKYLFYLFRINNGFLKASTYLFVMLNTDDNNIEPIIIITAKGKDDFYNQIISFCQNIHRPDIQQDQKYVHIICFKLLNFLESHNITYFTELHDFFLKKKSEDQRRKTLNPIHFFEELSKNTEKYKECNEKRRLLTPCNEKCKTKCEELYPFKSMAINE